MTPRFYYSVCQAGAEKVVRDEVLSAHPGLRSAFSRPGFITFKEDSNAGDPIDNPMSIFSRLWGESIGQARTPEEAHALLAKIPSGATVHAFERDSVLPGDEPEEFVLNARVRSLLDSWKIPCANQSPKEGEWVYDWILLDESTLFLGRHLHQPGIDPAPGNRPFLALPANAPSRAWLKIEEAIRRFRPAIQKSAKVLEIGCSPGGATTALLSRGLLVTGIDPKRMDPSVERHRAFSLIQKTAKTVQKEDFRGWNPEWLVLDMNLAPLEALDEVGHVLRLLREMHGSRLALQSGFLTVKLNDWKFAASIPLYLRRIEELGFRELAAVQLCSNRQEFFVHAGSFR